MPLLLLRLRRHLLSTSPLPHRRHMGGGPRTFPGGLSKWKYRRMHEKLARDKEKRLLDEEKQLYRARLRTHLRSQSPDPSALTSHLKSLADRFSKPGADDLWNDHDGPVKSLPDPDPKENPIDLRKLGSDRWGKVEAFYGTRRGFATESRASRRFRARCGSGEESESDSSYSVGDEEGGGAKVRRSAAALGEYDKKKTRRVSVELLERISSRQEVECIKEELERRRGQGGEGRVVVEEAESVFTNKRFDECGVSPLTIKALSLAGYEQMSVVQAAALPVCLDGKDALVKAKAGTGKSAAFLLPVIEAVLKAMTNSTNRRVPPILALILCPTRELASQITAEANVLVRHHAGVNVQTLVGGTRFKVDQKLLESTPPQIIVATPGRLLDHIENKAGFSVRLMGLKVIVIDEADHLLDLGFRSDIEKIIDCVPRQRQALLFSATVPKEVRRMSQLMLNKDHVFIDTVGLGGVETHDKVSQSYIIAPHEYHFELVNHLLKEHIMQEPEYKVIVFCTTAMVTSLMFLFLRNMKMNVKEIHSRKPQLYRTRISEEFRASKRLILVTSDVSARGMNYPDVTLVIQVGIPTDREQYIHRLGRTGREGKDGRGILLLAPWEEYFMDEIKDLPVEKSEMPILDSDAKQKAEESMQCIDTGVKEAAYHAWLGYYNSIGEIGRDKTNLVELANKFCASIALQKPPPLFRKTALKMGLKDISGIRIKK